MLKPRLRGVPLWCNSKYFTEINTQSAFGNNGAIGLKEKFKDDVFENMLRRNVPAYEVDEHADFADFFNDIHDGEAELVSVTKTHGKTGAQFHFYYV